MANKPFKKLRFSLTGDTYSPVDEQARQDIGDLSQLDTTHKDNLVEAINEAAQSGGSGEDNVFWATIGTTTYTQISNAINDDKLVCAKKSLASGKSRIYYCLGKPFDSTYFLFVATTPTTIYSYHVNTNEWTEQFNTDVLKLATSLPVMDGVASTGVLVKAAKADHVHPTDTSRASAADVGVLSELDTTAKSNLVSAINEVLATVSPSAQQIQDAVDAYLDAHPALTGMFTNSAKNALLTLLEKVAYIDQNGQTYLDNLRTLLATEVSSISAVFTQGANIVYEFDSLDSLKSMLVVTATYSDNTYTILSDAEYTLSGTLTVGTSVVTVSYGDKTDTFNVTVSEYVFPYGIWQPAEVTHGYYISDTGEVVAYSTSGYINDYIPVMLPSYWIGYTNCIFDPNSNSNQPYANWRVTEYDGNKNFIKQTHFDPANTSANKNSDSITFDQDTKYIRLGWSFPTDATHVGAFRIENPATLNTITFESGDIDGTTGANKTGNTRIREVAYFDAAGTISIANCPFGAGWNQMNRNNSGYAFRCYDATDNFVGSLANSGALFDADITNVSLPTNTTKVRMFIQLNNFSFTSFANIVANLITIDSTDYLIVGS